MKKVPCETCISFAICKARYKNKFLNLKNIDCEIIVNYIFSKRKGIIIERLKKTVRLLNIE